MKQKQRGNGKRRVAKSVLRVPDFEVAKSAVLNSMSCQMRNEVIATLRRVHGLVLFRATPVLQKDDCRPLSD